MLSRLLASFGTAATVLLLVLSMAANAADGKARFGEFIPQKPPRPAPEATFADSAGNPVSLDDFKGKPVLVNLWATWCEPCLREMPSLDRLQEKFADRLAVLAISQDRGGAKVVEPFVEKLGLARLKIYLDPKSAVGRAFAVRGLPTSIVLDAEGRVVGHVEGAAEWDTPPFLAVVEPLLAPASVTKPEGAPAR